MIERIAVESSNLTSVGYDPATQVLEVEFAKGAVYSYADVPPELYAELMDFKQTGVSVGKFVAQRVVKEYRGVKVVPKIEIGHPETT